MKNKKYLGIAALVFAAGIFAGQDVAVSATETASEAVTEAAPKDNASKETISNGIFIGDVDVSGMTVEEAKKAVEDGMAEIKSTSITLKVDDTKESVTAEEFGLAWENTEVVDEAVALGKSGNIVKRYKDNKDLEHDNKKYEMEYSTDKDKIRKVVKSKAESFNREAINASITTENGTFEVIAGQNGVAVNTNKSVNKIFKFMENEWDQKSATIELKADVTEPEYTTEELEKIKDPLGTATTYYGSTAARNQNVQVGASKLNGHLIMPGEVFSVTEAVVPFTEENGYLPAPSYASGKVVDTYGGGICQVSTTLYNAVLKAELEIVERHNHSMIVTYVDPSKDAAIAEGAMDFRFANNKEYPIYIVGGAYGGELTFTIYGCETRDPNRVVEYISETTGSTTPEGAELIAVSQPVGYISQTQSAHQGLTAVLWKQVTINGETTKEQVNSSHYQAVPATYEIGVNTDNPELAAAIQAAIASGDLAKVQEVINGDWEEETEPETEADKDKDKNEQKQTEPQADIQPETQAPDAQPSPEVPDLPADIEVIE